MTTAHANNPPPTIKADAPNRYIVKKGDTLWDISGRYLDSPWRWKEIWATNKQIKNPNLIYPDDILILCVIQGKTLVGVDTGEGCAGIEKQLTGNVVASTVAITSTLIDPACTMAAIQHWLDKTLIDPEDFNTPHFGIRKSQRITASGIKSMPKASRLSWVSATGYTVRVTYMWIPNPGIGSEVTGRDWSCHIDETNGYQPYY